MGVTIDTSILFRRGEGALTMRGEPVGVICKGRYLPPGVRFDGVILNPADAEELLAAAQQGEGS